MSQTHNKTYHIGIKKWWKRRYTKYYHLEMEPQRSGPCDSFSSYSEFQQCVRYTATAILVSGSFCKRYSYEVRWEGKWTGEVHGNERRGRDGNVQWGRSTETSLRSRRRPEGRTTAEEDGKGGRGNRVKTFRIEQGFGLGVDKRGLVPDRRTTVHESHEVYLTRNLYMGPGPGRDGWREVPECSELHIRFPYLRMLTH